ncbi:MAG: 30S ribosomal protein S12 methylthiotransferase RimO [Gudongella sp.]|nr:30S ribosomal protein S12 methylthiotransferase RimO [Gudongella sp.]
MSRKTVYIETLGCSKNEVDSEIMRSILDKENFDYTTNPEIANIIIVNTCGFIEDAKEESIDAIFEMSKYKTDGKLEKLVLAGCLAQRYANELIKEIPEVDAIMGTGNIRDLNSILLESSNTKKIIKKDDINSSYIEEVKRLPLSKTAYVRISEGCDNLCTYCIIPKLRGKHRSRKFEDIISEITYLGKKGVKEIILIAQNTSDYGIDLYGEYSLYKLLDKINDVDNIEIIRLLYLYPDNIDDKLIKSIKRNGKVAHYLDIPLQHISNNILKAMNRKTTKETIENLISKLRKNIPDIILRTTFIIGFPGETDEDFDELYNFIENIKFDKLGVFSYSKEEDTPAFGMQNQIDELTKQERINKIMELQKNISEELMRNKIGLELSVLVEEFEEENLYVGRSYMDSPEIDGVIYINSNKDLELGEFYNVVITEYTEYDLIGDVIDESGK